MNGNGSSAVWKYIATVAVTVLIAGSPGLIFALRTWNLGIEVKQIRERQDDVRTRLTIAETRLMELQSQYDELRVRVRELEVKRG